MRDELEKFALFERLVVKTFISNFSENTFVRYVNVYIKKLLMKKKNLTCIPTMKI